MTENNDFARLARASDGRQFLFYKSTDDEGKPQLRQVFEHEGVIVEFNVSFTDDDAGWKTLDMVFPVVDPDRVLAQVLATINGD